MKAFKYIGLVALIFSLFNFVNKHYKSKADVSDLKIPKGVKKLLKDFKYIPMGSFNMGTSDAGSIAYSRPSRTVSVQAFYISAYEVTNGEYLGFYKYKVKHTGKFCADLLPDTLVWRENLTYNEPYVDYYFRHPAYRNYPVVGINHWQALEYCKWMTDTITDIYKIEAPKEENNKFKFTLPTEAEWEHAARGGKSISTFPWGDSFWERDKEGKYKPMANSGSISDQTGYVVFSGGQGNEGNADVTAPVKSYAANGYGLYNTAGNVSEWTLDVYQNTWNFSHDLNPDFYRKTFHPDSVKKEKYDRVIKGGGWRDPPAYLITGSARPMREDSTRADVGFRIIFNYFDYSQQNKSTY